MALISIVIPAYNEQQNIERTANVLTEILEKHQILFELVFVSDGSKDETFQEIERLSMKDERIKGAEFSRNFGKESAIFAGMELSMGDACVVIDCDLQHPPQMIPEMVKLWQAGFEIVEGVKSSRGKEGVLHKAFAGAFYGIMSSLMKMNMKDTSDYKLLDRKVMDVLLALRERNTFFRALTFWSGFRSTKIEYEVQEREIGSSKWSFKSLIKYAISNVTSFSTIPLQIVTVMGLISIVFSVVLGIQTLIRFFMGNAVEGFTTVILLLLVIGGCIMLSLGIIGHYLARIYEEVKGRPKYIIRSVTSSLTKERP